MHIATDLGPTMRHFPNNVDAIVVGSYADQYNGSNHQSYTLCLLDQRGRGYNQVSWYKESQLTFVNADRDKGERILQLYNQRHEGECDE